MRMPSAVSSSTGSARFGDDDMESAVALPVSRVIVCALEASREGARSDFLASRRPSAQLAARKAEIAALSERLLLIIVTRLALGSTTP